MILRGIFPLPLLPLPPLVLLPHALRMSTRMIPATIHSCLFLAFILSSPLLSCLVTWVTSSSRQTIPMIERSSRFMDFHTFIGISYTDDEPAVGADSSLPPPI